MSVFRELMVKDYVTLVGTITGTAAILLAILGAYYGDPFLILCATFSWGVALGADLFDGWVARKLNQVNAIGKEIDSLSDAVSFVVAPGIIILSATLIDEFPMAVFPKWIIFVGVLIFVFCGIIRLAWFNVANIGEGYTGLVTPMSAAIMVLLFISHYHFNRLLPINPDYYHALAPLTNLLMNPLALTIYMTILGGLNLAPILKYSGDMQKKRGTWVTILTILGIFIVLMIILAAIFNEMNQNLAILVGYIFPLAFLCCIIAYIIHGFINYLSQRKSETPS
ncbi:MAG: CDP-alcohol phosphatidyltransferase family protein [Candidatus Helarchaeota archaeon]